METCCRLTMLSAAGSALSAGLRITAGAREGTTVASAGIASAPMTATAVTAAITRRFNAARITPPRGPSGMRCQPTMGRQTALLLLICNVTRPAEPKKALLPPTYQPSEHEPLSTAHQARARDTPGDAYRSQPQSR